MLVMNLLGAGGAGPDEVPIFPLQTVLFPGMRLPLRIFEPRYMDMAKACLKHDGAFGVCLIREGEEVGGPAVPQAVGCLARIADWDMQQLGILAVRAEGGDRFRLGATRTTPAGLVVGEIERFEAESPARPPELEACAGFARKVIETVGAPRFAPPFHYDDASWVGFRLAEILPLRNDVRQRLLELTDAAGRLAVLHRFLKEQRLLG